VTTVIHALDHLLSLVPAGYQRRGPPHGRFGVLPAHGSTAEVGVRIERSQRRQEGLDVLDGQIGHEPDGGRTVEQGADSPRR
jgi:hypothetical protein